MLQPLCMICKLHLKPAQLEQNCLQRSEDPCYEISCYALEIFITCSNNRCGGVHGMAVQMLYHGSAL